MPLNRFECPLCGHYRESFKQDPKCNHGQEEEGIPVPLSSMVKILVAPQSKFLEPSNKEKGKSQLKDQKQILMQRAKDYAQNNERDDFIQGEPDKVASKARGWLREDGTKRKKIDDL